jgi:predicted ATP-grasp superfamily ATP-dependent carboligase
MLMMQELQPALWAVAIPVALLALVVLMVRVRASRVQRANAHLPPVLILGGEANALSVARDLSRIGVKVFVISAPDSTVRYSRHCRWIDVPVEDSAEESWSRFLTGPDSDYLQGAVLLACSDMGIGVLIKHWDELASRFKLDLSNLTAQRAMLDKLSTYEIARAAGIPAPAYWIARSREQILELRHELKFPLLVKPRHSHVFERRFGRKHFVASDFEQLLSAFDEANEAGMQTLLVELIPGADDKLCSYYTYLDEQGKPLFHFTKRVIRRFPSGMGTGCYHITDWIPEIVQPSLKLFEQAGLRGLANIEFKLDERDGQYKLIECNARFTAANSLVAASGFGLAEFVYNRILGLPQKHLVKFKTGMRLLDPARDLSAYLELRRMGQLSLLGWIRSLLHHQTFPYFAWTDPGPSVARLIRPLRRRLRGQPTKTQALIPLRTPVTSAEHP